MNGLGSVLNGAALNGDGKVGRRRDAQAALRLVPALAGVSRRVRMASVTMVARVHAAGRMTLVGGLSAAVSFAGAGAVADAARGRQADATIVGVSEFAGVARRVRYLGADLYSLSNMAGAAEGPARANLVARFTLSGSLYGVRMLSGSMSAASAMSGGLVRARALSARLVASPGVSAAPIRYRMLSASLLTAAALQASGTRVGGLAAAITARAVLVASLRLNPGAPAPASRTFRIRPAERSFRIRATARSFKVKS